MTYNKADLSASAQALVDKVATLPDNPPDEPPPPPPPPPAPKFDPLAVTDELGGITYQYLYGAGVPSETLPKSGEWLKWERVGGDWADADGVMHGPKQFAETTLAIQIGGPKINLDLTALAKLSPSVQFRLHATNSGIARFHARNTADPPRLEVTYADGTAESLVPTCEVGCNYSTNYMLVNRAYLEVGANVCMYLRYDCQQKEIATATLVLTPIRVWSITKLGVVRFAHRYVPQPDPLPPYGGELLWSTQAFEDSPPWLRRQMQDIDSRQQLANVDDGGRAMELTVDPAVSNVVSAIVGIWPEATQAVLRYKLKFLAGSEVAFQEQGKLPGLRTASLPDDDELIRAYGSPFPPGTLGTLLAGNGGTLVNGRNGWSARGGYGLPRKSPQHPLASRWLPFSYVYHPDHYASGETHGDHVPWSAYGVGALEPDRWYEVEHYVKVNTPGLKDGVIEARIDKRLALRRDNFRFREPGPYTLADYGVDTDLALRGAWICGYHGGPTKPLMRRPWLRWKEFGLYRVA